MSSTGQWTVTKQMMVEIDGGAANPGDMHIPLGKWDPGTGLSWRTRALVYAPVSFAGMASITSARLYLHAHTAAGFHANNTSPSTVVAYRKVSDWNEGSAGTTTAVDEVWGGNGKSLVIGGFAEPHGQTTWGQNGVADGTLQPVDITDIVRGWFAGDPNYGLLILNSNETSAASGLEYYSRHASGLQPYIEITYETNNAPNAPTNLSPSGNALSGSSTLYWNHSDPDAGDRATSAEVYFYDAAGTQINHNESTDRVGADGFLCSWQAWPVVSGRRYQWKAHTFDGVSWGPFCALQGFYYEPPQPAPSLSSPANLATVTTLTPKFKGTEQLLGDSTMALAQVQVYDSTGTSLIWDSGGFSATGTTFAKTYSGPALSWGVQYQWRARTKTSLGTWSAWTAGRAFNTDDGTGAPLNVFPSDEKVVSLHPDIGFDAAPGDTIQSWDYQVYEADGSTLNDSGSGLTTDITGGNHVSHNFAANTLSRGNTYKVRFRYATSGGGTGPWSAKQSFAVNAKPSAPTLVAPANGAFLTTLTPTFEWVFNDDDSEAWGDTQQAYTLEVRDNATDALIATLTGTTATSRLYDGTALSSNTTYKWRVFTNDGDQDGSFSSYQTFVTASAPSAAGVTLDPADLNASGHFTNATPTVEWVYSSPDSAPQAAFRVVVSDGTTVIYDSGEQAGSAIAYEIPTGVPFVTGASYTFEVFVKDNRGVWSPEADSAPIQAEFAPPAALTGLSTFADLDAAKVTVSWDASGDPAFDHYEVWRRPYGASQWTVIADSLSASETSFDDYSAALNVTYEYAALQVTLIGAALVKGDYAPITTQLGIAVKWYFVAEGHDDLTVALTWVDGFDESVPIQQQTVEALGRSFKIVVEGRVLGSEGTLTIVLSGEDRALSAKVETLLRQQLERVLIKSPDGDVYPAKLGSLTRRAAERGGIELSVPFTQIEAA